MEDINTLTQKANSGDAVAMRKLGYEYLIGKNIQKDEKKAFQLFRAAVWEGDLNATIYCGYCCKTGAAVRPDSWCRTRNPPAASGANARHPTQRRLTDDHSAGRTAPSGGASCSRASRLPRPVQETC